MKEKISTDLQTLSEKNQDKTEDIKKGILQITDEYFETIYNFNGVSRNKEEMKKKFINQITNKYNELRSQFNQFYSNEKNIITFKELIQFFASLPNAQVTINEGYIGQLLTLMKCLISNNISINHFIFDYIRFEEKILKKLITLNNLSDKLKENRRECLLKKEEMKNERMNKEGVCDNASLSLTIFEAKDIRNIVTQTFNNSFVVLSLGGIKQKSANKENYKWDQDLTFPVTKKNEKLQIGVYEKSMNAENILIGSVSVELMWFDHQFEAENWYQLENNNKQKCGSILLKICFIYSWYKYYSDYVSKTDIQISRLNKDIKELEESYKLSKQPFELVLAGKILSIQENKIFEKSENIVEYVTSIRQSVYNPKNNCTNKESVYLELNKHEWPLSIKIVLMTNLISSFSVFFTRADYLNLVTSIISFLFIFGESKGEINFNLQLFVYTLIGLSCYDILWIILHHNNWSLSIYLNSYSLICTFIISIINCVAKCALVILVFSYKVRINEIKTEGIAKIMENKIH